MEGTLEPIVGFVLSALKFDIASAGHSVPTEGAISGIVSIIFYTVAVFWLPPEGRPTDESLYSLLIRDRGKTLNVFSDGFWCCLETVIACTTLKKSDDDAVLVRGWEAVPKGCAYQATRIVRSPRGGIFVYRIR